jgi:hypothetical protein
LIDAILQAGKEWKEPVLEPEQVSSAVVDQIVSGNGGQIFVPKSTGVASMLRGFPNWLQERIRDKASQGFIRLRELELAIGK